MEVPPTSTPAKMPVALPMVAIARLPLVHVPPVEVLLSVIGLPRHTFGPPVIGESTGIVSTAIESVAATDPQTLVTV